MKSKQENLTICQACQGRGKKAKRIRKKMKLRYQRELDQFEKNKREGTEPVRPKGHLDTCIKCKGSGLTYTTEPVLVDNENYPHVAIIGGGIGGAALAVACLHRGIPFTLYERDNDFNARSQGYGLTLQQASRAIDGLGITQLTEGIVSTRHLVHTIEGHVIGEWGVRKWAPLDKKTSSKRTNIHIARQSLRLALLEQLGESKNNSNKANSNKSNVQWGHKLVDIKTSDDGHIDLSFKVENQLQKSNRHHVQADLVVGADGIRSTVRRLLVSEEVSPLTYLGCIVILGICPLSLLEDLDCDLLDSATVFQTANGNERIYIMPYSSDSIMWQLSFPMPEEEAKQLSAQGTKALKEEAINRCDWHTPIPQILDATDTSKVSGYPVYDRPLIESEQLHKEGNITLIGDAAHPMSPFKGQGANQALLDALSLARLITKNCRPLSQWKKAGIRKSVLTEFESEMLARSATKVKDSAEAAKFLHSKVVLYEGNEPRGRCLKK